MRAFVKANGRATPIAPPSSSVDAERVEAVDRSPFVVVLRYESGRVEVASVDTFGEVAELRANAESGLSPLVSATAYARLP